MSKQLEDLERRANEPAGSIVEALQWKDLATAALADNARLRKAIEKAPCPNYELKHGHGRGICFDCACWKCKALEPTKGSE